MKYVLFFEAPPARGKIGSRSPEERAKLNEARQDEKYGKTILQGHFYASGKGIAIVEFDNPKQIANRMALGTPDLIYKICPLIPGPDWGEALEAARARSEESLQLTDRVTFQVGDVHNLEFPSFSSSTNRRTVRESRGKRLRMC